MTKSMQKQGIGFAVLAIVVFASFWFISLSKQQQQNISTLGGVVQPAIVPVTFTTIAHGNTAKVARRVNYLLTSSADLATLWKQIGASGAMPKVDFTTHQVLAVFAGPQTETGHAITVTKITDGTDRLVSIRLTGPGKGCANKKSSAGPYELVQVPTTTLSLTHEDSTAVVSCAPTQAN